MFCNCSTRVEEGAYGRKYSLNRLIRGPALAFAGIHDRAHGGQQVASPIRTQSMRHVPQDRAHADGLFARVLGGGHGDIVQQAEQVLLELGLAFLEPETVRVRGLAG
jgi:hypothetical protein